MSEIGQNGEIASPPLIIDEQEGIRFLNIDQEQLPYLKSLALMKSLLSEHEEVRYLVSAERIPYKERAYAKNTDAVNRLMAKAEEFALLTQQQEFDLAERIETGVMAFSVFVAGHNRLLTGVDREKVMAGVAAHHVFVNSNIRLVVKIASSYPVPYKLEQSDLVAAGLQGLNRAVDKFDRLKGFKFSTYATWWIRQSISREIADTSRTIRLPVQQADILKRVNEARMALLQSGIEDTPEAIAEEVDETVEQITLLMKYTGPIESLDRPIRNEESNVTIGHVISDPNSNVEADVIQNASSMTIKQLVQTAHLTAREAQVIAMRNGFNPEELRVSANGTPVIEEDDIRVYSLEEIGKHLGVSRERIRQIELAARNKIRITAKVKGISSADLRA